MKLKSSQNNQDGMISIYVLILSFFFLTTGLTLLSVHLSGFGNTMDIQEKMQARMLAESALQEGHYYTVRQSPGWTGTSSEFPVAVSGKNIGTYQYTVSEQCKKISLVGRGYIPNSSAIKKISVFLTQSFYSSDPWIVFSDGFESGNLASWGTITGDCSSDSGVGFIALNNGNANQGAWAARASASSAPSSTVVARLCTPVYDLSNCERAIVRFSYKILGSAPDSLKVYMDTGTGFGAALSTITPSSSSYGKPATRISVTSGLTSTTRFRLDAEISDSAQNLYLDDFAIAVPYSSYDADVD